MVKTNNEAVTRAAGGVMIDGKHVGDTRQCVHCSAHWVPVIGSGVTRGYCMNCKGVTCGQGPCDTCIPLEARLRGYERGTTKAEVLHELDGSGKTIILGP